LSIFILEHRVLNEDTIISIMPSPGTNLARFYFAQELDAHVIVYLDVHKMLYQVRTLSPSEKTGKADANRNKPDRLPSNSLDVMTSKLSPDNAC